MTRTEAQALSHGDLGTMRNAVAQLSGRLHYSETDLRWVGQQSRKTLLGELIYLYSSNHFGDDTVPDTDDDAHKERFALKARAPGHNGADNKPF